MIWDSEKVEQLRELRAQGKTFVQCAEIMGTTVGSVSSKCKKLNGKLPTACFVLKDEPPAIGPENDIADGCRWIHGDPRVPGWRMCGQPGEPWCAHHKARLNNKLTMEAA